MGKKKKKHDWHSLESERKQSGMNVSEFYAQKRINTGSYYNARSRGLIGKGAARGILRQDKKAFVSFGSLDSEPIRIKHPSGATIEVSSVQRMNEVLASFGDKK